MNYYFMLRVHGLKGAVTLADFPNSDGAVPWPEDMNTHVTWTDGERWQVREMGMVMSGQIHRYTEDDLPADCPKDASPFFFLYPRRLPETLDELLIESFMNTSPGWRGNIQLFSRTTAASYQGDYPSSMIPIRHGTLLSYSPFIQNGNDVKTLFIIPNLRQTPKIESCGIRFIGATTRTVYMDATLQSNHTSVVDISKIKPISGELILAVSKDLTGIPLYLSHTPEFTQMSLEHTHPPAELAVFGNRNHYQRNMKGYWLKEAYS